MRLVRVVCFAAMIAALIAPTLRADDWNRLTYLTFSGPVQVPGATLPAGTYMFKLADPSTGRKAIQIWDQEGKKLYTTLLSIPDEIMKAEGEPFVKFTETSAGEPAAVKAWFYPQERVGWEFVYPKDQAIRIAKASHSTVLAHADDTTKEGELSAFGAAKVGRVDEYGRFVDEQEAATATTTTAETATTTTATTTTLTAPEPQTTTTATATTTAAPAPSPAPLAEPEPAPAPVIAANEPAPAPVGTAGQAEARELPRTASDLALLQLLGGFSLAAAVALRLRRRRLAETDL